MKVKFEHKVFFWLVILMFTQVSQFIFLNLYSYSISHHTELTQIAISFYKDIPLRQ